MRQVQLDGVRGVAVLSVVTFHHFLFPAGWMGVDLFFVLSGFLITRTLLEAKHSQIYWAQFYIKRAGRILPPLIPILILAALLSRRATMVGLAGYALFLGNYINLTHYHIDVLNLLWSLAVEEHFYLLWPTAVRFLSRERCIALCVAILFIEPIIRVAVTSHYGAYYWPIYWLTWFRLDGVTAGSLLALLVPLSPIHNWLRRTALWMFFGFVFVYVLMAYIYGESFSMAKNTHLYNGLGYSIVVLGCAFLVAHLAFSKDSFLSRLLSMRPLVFLGEISYGMYLLHETTLAILRRLFHVGVGLPSVHGTRLLFLINFPLVVCLTWLSFRFYETPIIKWSRQRARLLEHSEVGSVAHI